MEYLRGGHEREVMITQWSVKRSIIVYKTYIQIRIINLYQIEISILYSEREFLPTFYMVMYPRNNILIHHNQKSQCSGTTRKQIFILKQLREFRKYSCIS